MKHMYKIEFKHWWYWFIPSMRRSRRLLQSFVDASEAQIREEMERRYFNLMLYGCSISPEEMYGKGGSDEPRNGQNANPESN